MPDPLISVVISTYNRSNVLFFALDCLRRQTIGDWEAWIIGDCCTDDTEQVVSSFNDPRFHFVNLKENSGNQAIPNSIGVSYCQGKYIAFLNHDDLWLSDHLETALEGIKTTQADLVFTLGECINDTQEKFFNAVASSRKYEPSMFVPATLWFFKKSLFLEVGPWRSPHECYNVPSQEWMFRAHKKGKNLQFIPQMTAVLIQSGTRKNSYRDRQEEENRSFHDQIVNDPKFREKELLSMILTLSERDPLNYTHTHLKIYVLRILKNILKKIVFLLGISMPALKFYLKYGKKGACIAQLNRTRGIDP